MDRQMPCGVRSRLAGLSMVAVALVVVATVPAWAQSAGSTIHGIVKDESGAAVPGCTCWGSTTAGSRTATTDAICG